MCATSPPMDASCESASPVGATGEMSSSEPLGCKGRGGVQRWADQQGPSRHRQQVRTLPRSTSSTVRLIHQQTDRCLLPARDRRANRRSRPLHALLPSLQGTHQSGNHHAQPDVKALKVQLERLCQGPQLFRHVLLQVGCTAKEGGQQRQVAAPIASVVGRAASGARWGCAPGVKAHSSIQTQEKQIALRKEHID